MTSRYTKIENKEQIFEDRDELDLEDTQLFSVRRTTGRSCLMHVFPALTGVTEYLKN